VAVFISAVWCCLVAALRLVAGELRFDDCAAPGGATRNGFTCEHGWFHDAAVDRAVSVLPLRSAVAWPSFLTLTLYPFL
jgi:hypothetical protein